MEFGHTGCNPSFSPGGFNIPQRPSSINPYYLSIPWKGSVNLDADRMRKPKWGYVAMRLLYGAKCAPMRWFHRISNAFARRDGVRRGWIHACSDGKMGGVIRSRGNARRRFDGVWG